MLLQSALDFSLRSLYDGRYIERSMKWVLAINVKIDMLVVTQLVRNIRKQTIKDSYRAREILFIQRWKSITETV